jgi:hypothetical protein
MRKAMGIVAGLFFLVGAVLGEERPQVMVGFFHREAEQYEAEWRLYTGYYPTLAKNGMRGALIESRPLYRGPLATGQLYEMMRPFHVIVLCACEEGMYRMTEEIRNRVMVARADLERYVCEGGGLFLLLQAVRYPGDDDERFHNLLIEPFGCRMLHEGVFDKANVFTSPATLVFRPMEFFVTANIRPHPATEGVKRLYLPKYATQPNPGVEALGLDENWKVVVAGHQTAKSYYVGDDNALNLDREGSQKSAPPIAAVRMFGKGRILICNVPNKHTFLNYGNRMWPQITESEGDKESGKPSQGNQLLINALRWLAESAQQVEGFGTHKLAPIQPVKFEPSVNWDAQSFEKGAEGVRGILGAHSAYSDGQGTVAEYVKAARAEGLSFIAFTDPLELLTPEELAKLQSDCAKAGAEDFYACPGVEFTDSLGVRWAVWGEKVMYPEDAFESGGRKYAVWDGKRLVCTGRYENMCRFGPNGIIDYRALRAANAHPANLWWFYRIFPFAYEGDKLIADNFNEYLYALRDLRWMSVDAFTRVRSPQEVAGAAKACVSVVRDLKSARELLNSRCGSALASRAARHYVTQGPRILAWEGTNTQMENPWQKTRGAQRVRLRFEVASEDGIAEVKVHDADYGVVRRFDGHGAKTLTREFEMVQDKQHYLVLEVTDTQGQRAISWYLFIFCYKSGLYRCGDNLNILGSAQLCWHPDRNEMTSLAKFFEDGFKCTVLGIDSAAPIATQPKIFAQEAIQTSEGTCPASREEIVNKILDVPLGSYNLQIYSATMAYRSERFDTEKRPTPSLGPISRRLGPLEVFERKHTSYALASRQDYFVTWNFRRPFEGSKDYRGSIIWHEGEIRFKKDVTLKGAVPAPLVLTEGPGGAEFRTYDQFLVTDRDAGTLSVRLETGREKPYRRQGVIRAGGYCAAMNTDLGYVAFLAPSKSEFTYVVAGHPQAPTAMGRTMIGLGRDGQQVKAGTVWPYRFAMATLNDHRLSNELLEDMVRGYNLDGGTAGYPYSVKTGRFVDAELFFTVQAEGNEAEFSIGPRDLICDLPFRVHGVEDNGCAVVYVAGRPPSPGASEARRSFSEGGKFFRFVSVVEGTAYFQEPVSPAAEMWVGNPFVCENKDVRLVLAVDGQASGKPPRLEVHNPTAKELETRLFSPPHTPLFGGLEAAVRVPAGDSIFFRVVGKQLKPEAR